MTWRRLLRNGFNYVIDWYSYYCPFILPILDLGGRIVQKYKIWNGFYIILTMKMALEIIIATPMRFAWIRRGACLGFPYKVFIDSELCRWVWKIASSKALNLHKQRNWRSHTTRSEMKLLNLVRPCIGKYLDFSTTGGEHQPSQFSWFSKWNFTGITLRMHCGWFRVVTTWLTWAFKYDCPIEADMPWFWALWRNLIGKHVQPVKMSLRLPET